MKYVMLFLVCLLNSLLMIQTVQAESRITLDNHLINSNKSLGISTRVRGRLSWVAATGRNVKVNDVIALLDNRQLTMQLRQEMADIISTKVKLTKLRSRLKTLKLQIKMDLIARDAYNKVIGEQRVLQQNLLEARVNQTVTESSLARTIIRAPMSGRVQRKTAKTGNVVGRNEIIMQIVSHHGDHRSH